MVETLIRKNIYSSEIIKVKIIRIFFILNYSDYFIHSKLFISKLSCSYFVESKLCVLWGSTPVCDIYRGVYSFLEKERYEREKRDSTEREKRASVVRGCKRFQTELSLFV